MKWIILLNIILLVQGYLDNEPPRGSVFGGFMLIALAMFWVTKDD